MCNNAHAEIFNPHFNLYLNEDGLYRLSYEELNLPEDNWLALDFAKIKLSSQGHSVPFWVNDNGDGLWQKGDYITFIGKHLRGENSWFGETSDINVYQLWLNNSQYVNLAMVGQADTINREKQNAKNTLITRKLHLEKELLKAPLTNKDFTISPNIWYWSKFHANSQTPFSVDFKLTNMKKKKHDVILDIQLRGASEQLIQSDFDHIVNITINGKKIGHIKWNGKTEYQQQFLVSSNILNSTNNQLLLSVPKRKNKISKHDVIDSVYLDWIELNYKVNDILTPSNMFLSSDNKQIFTIQKQNSVSVLYTERGMKTVFNKSKLNQTYEVKSQNSDKSGFYLVKESQYKQVQSHQFRSSNIEKNDNVDYLMITHPAFIIQMPPLIQMHERQGKAVQLIDTLSIYDEYNYGVFSSQAIKDAINDFYILGNKQLKYVLLIGDASWFSHGKKDLYDVPIDELSHKNLLPTWQTYTPFGSAASDAPFALPINNIPNIAVGRFAVSSKQDLTALIDKTIRYSEEIAPGFWKSQLNMLSENGSHYISRNKHLLSGVKNINNFSVKSILDNSPQAMWQQNVVNSFNEGQLLLHFYGHGGRFMWELGKDSTDQSAILFDKSQVKKLQNKTLPVVLSMTCSTGPFDHPNANSLVEELLNKPHYGAVAIISSSARNNPAKRFSQFLLNTLLGGESIGESLLQAKIQSKRNSFIEVYNLLGDPAIKLNMPDLPIHIEAINQSNEVRITIPAETFEGELLIKEENAKRQITKYQEVKLLSKTTIIKLQPSTKSVLVYAYDKGQKIDAYGQYLTQPILIK